MSKTFEPNSRFVESLEWQLSSEYRRMDRMKAAGKIAVPRRMAAAALVAGVLTAGVTVIKAADLIRDSWRKKIELARVQTEVEIKKARRESLRELAASSEQLFKGGLVREEEYLVAKLSLERAGLDLERAQLNRDEVKASGLPPRDELYAPLAGGRDFVSARLRVESSEVKTDLDLLTANSKRIQELVEKALAPKEDLSRLQAEIEARKRTIDAILKRIELRKRFVAGEITAQDVEIKDRTAAAETNLSQAKAKVEALKAEFERLQALEAKGMVSSRETGMLRFALDAAEAELKLATVEIDVLKQVK